MKNQKLLSSFYFFALLFTLLIITGCSKNKNLWKRYSYPEYKGYLYTQFEEGKVNAVICGEMSGIRGAMKLDHVCTQEQYDELHQKLIEQNGEYMGLVRKPKTWGYPDLSAYLTFVFSYDELHGIWCDFGLEEEE